MKSKFGFILVKPQLGENIGACARSMKNFGFSKLYIVDPKINFPNHKTKATSVGAYDIINKAKVFDNVEKAIEPFNLVIALSARRRDINKRHISLQKFQKKHFFKNTIFFKLTNIFQKMHLLTSTVFFIISSFLPIYIQTFLFLFMAYFYFLTFFYSKISVKLV